MRRWIIVSAIVAVVALSEGIALACAGLVAPNGSVKLLRTATLAAYHNGIEHYITSFEFKGGGAKFGSIVPLPDLPKKVTRGGKYLAASRTRSHPAATGSPLRRKHRS